MESVNDCAYRKMCFELGAGYTFTEMVRPAAIIRRNPSTLSRIDTFDPATPTSLQLLGSPPDQLRGALETLDELAESEKPHWRQGVHGLDINFGCPSTTVLKAGLGPVLLNRPRALQEVLEIMAEWRARTQLPIGTMGIKIRLGVNADDEYREVYVRAIQIARRVGMDYVALHARHARDDSKTTKARWEHIRRAKDVVGDGLKILGNGDVYTRADARSMMKQTGCDGVLIARGSIRTAGVIFDPAWQDDDESVCAAADRLQKRYADLSRQFGGPRSKLAEYHRESFRRIRVRGERHSKRQRWRRLASWLRKECAAAAAAAGSDDEPHLELEESRILEHFSPDVRIHFCSLEPPADEIHEGVAGAAAFLPRLAWALHASNADSEEKYATSRMAESPEEVHVPLEEAELDARQVFVGLSNAWTVTSLFGADGRIARLSVLCAAAAASVRAAAPEEEEEVVMG